jgi:peptide-methionine (S)-S-oxide reductase
MAEQKQEKVGETAVFAGGCFWCTEAVFSMLRGVKSVMPGYAGGKDGGPTSVGPTYEQVSNGDTGYAESLKIEFDPSVISYEDLLSVFFNTHDPTTLNRQGNDVGTQYRSDILYSNEEQKHKAEALIKELDDSHAYDKPVVTEVQPLGEFYPAEDYHRDYYRNHPDAGYCELVIAPKLEKLQMRFAELLKS